MPRRHHIPLAALAGLALAACGGQIEATPRAGRAEPTPVLATLASSGGGTAELRAGDLAAARAAFQPHYTRAHIRLLFQQ